MDWLRSGDDCAVVEGQEKKQMKVLLDDKYPEETDPHVLYELEAKLQTLSEILVKWNRKEIEPNLACYKIWKLFKDYALREWRKTEFRKR